MANEMVTLGQGGAGEAGPDHTSGAQIIFCGSILVVALVTLSSSKNLKA